MTDFVYEEPDEDAAYDLWRQRQLDDELEREREKAGEPAQ